MDVSLVLFMVLTFQGIFANSNRTVSFETINTFLMEVFADDLRHEALVSELKKSSSDVICLQEVWSDLRLSRLCENLAVSYPYSYSSLHAKDGFLPVSLGSMQSKCRKGALERVLECSVSACKNERSLDKFFECNFKKCKILQTLGAKCFECYVMQANICKYKTSTRLSLTEFLICLTNDLFSQNGMCTQLGSEPNRNLGLLILSKIPLRVDSLTTFIYNENVIIKRGILEAKLEDEYESLVSCTHLSADSSSFFDYAAGFNSWFELKQDEINTLINRYSGKSNVYIMGDFNVGPELPKENINGYFPELYKKLSDSGFNNLAVDYLHLCSFCKKNMLVKVVYKEKAENLIIDGIIPLKVSREFKTIKRTAMKNISLPLNFDFCVSDHWGIKASFYDY
ncbi:DgyrCDS11756 [Dimorphilus gyrociliatus]|uniref:DgyrCDS11756 n=1 Tax=Dimorphilus gyrociliatus TaxID=2664684 RepID=A0A7I8W4I7_9ANNE|nr:DgyrCDS11756 [Dimorphilus gyrociliatus]